MSLDLLVFSLGVCAGALAALPWLWPVLTQYVMLSRCPSPQRCPHHRATWERAVTQANDRNRHQEPPTRPTL